MPVHMEQRGDYWVVVDHKGKVYGRHKSRKGAGMQVKAVNIHEGYVPGVEPKGEKK